MLAGTLFDVAVAGGGIVGMATAWHLVQHHGWRVVLLEAETQLAAHQTGHNSGVVHSGLYYGPGSLKARLCVEGRRALDRFCTERGIAYERCGKIVVATRAEELPRLDELERRGRANGLQGLRRLAPEEIRAREPHATGVAALLVPETGIVDFAGVTEALASEVRRAGGAVETSARLVACRRDSEGLVLETTRGDVRSRALVACCGLYADRVARLCGVEPGVRIVPFRGEYYELRPERQHLVRHLIYPVPDPRFPFLGVHFTRRVQGGVEAGPNAVVAWKREGYRRTSFALRDAAEMVGDGGFWRLARRHWRRGAGEMWRSWSTDAFVAALQRLVPELGAADVRRAGAGVRAQALAPDGSLVDDFHLVEAERMIHVLNAPSPAATASLAIGRTIAARVVARFALEPS